nr:hypothetical protein [Asaia astilbis]
MDTLFRHEFHPSILREYDIRGIVGETLFENDARALGVVFSSVLRELGKNDVVIGHDGRLSSPALEQALLEGLLSGGMSVTRLGCCPTPELYFTSVARKASGAIMVTGSHNPIGIMVSRSCSKTSLFSAKPCRSSRVRRVRVLLKNQSAEELKRSHARRGHPTKRLWPTG